MVRTLPRHWLESYTVTADSFYPALFVCFLCLLAVHSHILRYIRADLTAVFAVTTVYQIARFHCLVFGISDMQQNGIPSATLTIGTLRLTAERGKNLSAASGVAYIRLGAILTFLAAPNAAPNPLSTSPLLAVITWVFGRTVMCAEESCNLVERLPWARTIRLQQLHSLL